MKIDKKTTAISVQGILSGDRGRLRELAEHRARLVRIETLIGEALPEPVNRHCRVMNLSRGVLVMLADAPVWITRLRFDSARLLACLRAYPELGDIHELQFRTVPNVDHGARRPDPPSPVLPATAAAQLRATASTVSEPALREALLRLASRAGQS